MVLQVTSAYRESHVHISGMLEMLIKCQDVDVMLQSYRC